MMAECVKCSRGNHAQCTGFDGPMATDTTALQERIERELEEMFDGGGFSARDMARDLAPIIAAEVQAARVEAWQDGHTAGFEDALLACGRAAGFKPGPPLGPTSNLYREDPTR